MNKLSLILCSILVLICLPLAPAWAQSDPAGSDYPADDPQQGDTSRIIKPPSSRVTKPPVVRPTPRTVPRPGTKTKPPTPGTKSNKVSLSFKDVDIKVFIQFVAKLTGKTYVVSDKVTGRVTVLTPGPVSVDEAVRIFGSVLQVKGFVTVQSGGVVMVVPAREGRWQGATEVQSGAGKAEPGKQMVTRVITLEHASADNIKRNIRPLAGLHANVAAYSESNTLVITDVASNVDRLTTIIRTLDRPGVTGLIRVVPLEHANAKDLATALEKLFARPQVRTPGKAPMVTVSQAQLKVLADERTNSVILLGQKGDIEKAIATIRDLDRAEVQGRYNINVIRLKYAVAEELSKVFNQLSGATSTIPAAPSTKGKKTTPAADKIKLLSGDIRVVAEPATNSLIISAAPSEFKVIEAIVAKLDIPRTMVYVETVILEMSASKSLEFGIDWNAAAQTDDGFIFGGSGGLPTGGVPEASSPGLNLGFMGGTVKFGDIEIPNLSALVRAVQTDSDIRVVATPQILTADNEEASIQVATNLPFVTRVDQGSTDDTRTVQVFEYRDVGFTLKVTPRISDANTVRLNLETESKSVVSAQTTDSEGNTLLAPTTNVRQAKTVVLTRNDEIVAIGGLINQEAEDTGNQVPCLGNIPALGWAFKSTKDTSKRTNLLIFLAPHILATEDDIRALSREKLKQGRDFTPPEKKDLLSPLRPKREIPHIFKDLSGSGTGND